MNIIHVLKKSRQRRHTYLTMFKDSLEVPSSVEQARPPQTLAPLLSSCLTSSSPNCG